MLCCSNGVAKMAKNIISTRGGAKKTTDASKAIGRRRAQNKVRQKRDSRKTGEYKCLFRRDQHQPLRRCVSTNTQTSKNICCVHACPGGVIPLQLKRHCSVGGQVSRQSTALRSPQKQTCSIIAAPCISGHGCVSPDFTPQRRPSRASCPSPRRERSPSPSCSRKTSLPLSGAEPV